MKKHFILILFYLYFLGNMIAQNNHVIDSLQKIIAGKYHDTVKIAALNELGMNYYLFDLKKAKQFWNSQMDYIVRTNKNAVTIREKYFYNSSKANAFGCIAYVYQSWGNLDSAIILYDSSKAIAKKIGDMETYASTINNLGVIYNYQGDMAKALDCYEQSYHMHDSLKIPKGAAMALNNIALIYKNQGYITKALEYHIRSLKISEKEKDLFSMGHAYNNIGVIYREQGEFSKGMDYFKKSFDIRKKINDLNGMALALNEIGVSFSSKKQYDSALVYHSRSLALREKLGDSTYIAQSLVNIGVVYVSEKNYLKAIDYFNRALFLKQLTQEQQGVADAYSHIGGTYYLMKKYPMAEENLLKALDIAKKLGFPSEIKRAAEKLSILYAEQGKYKPAYEMQALFKQMSDSIFNVNNRKATYKQQIKYDFEKKAMADSLEYISSLKIKDLEITKKDLETKKQRVLIYSFILVILLMTIFSIVIYRLFSQKKKTNVLLQIKNSEILQKNEEITAQRDEIEAQRNLVITQKEFIEDQKKEIDDSIEYAKRIQSSVLPSAKYFEAIFTETFIIFRPRSVVSGDFYWGTKINNWLIFTVADCTGHGVPGAFMSMLGMSFLNEIVRKKEITNSGEVLDNLRKSIIEALHQKGQSGEQKDGMDIAFCAINTDSLEMQFAGANNPCYIIRKQDCQLIELKGNKMPIGIHERMDSFTNQMYQLQKGDIIYLMSDGFEDQFGGPNRKKFLSKNLKNVLISNSLKSMTEQKQILETTLIEWIGDGEQIDDITILGIKI